MVKTRTLEHSVAAMKAESEKLHEESAAHEKLAAKHFEEVVKLREQLADAEKKAEDMQKRIDGLNDEVRTQKAATTAAQVEAAAAAEYLVAEQSKAENAAKSR